MRVQERSISFKVGIYTLERASSRVGMEQGWKTAHLYVRLRSLGLGQARKGLVNSRHNRFCIKLAFVLFCVVGLTSDLQLRMAPRLSSDKSEGDK